MEKHINKENKIKKTQQQKQTNIRKKAQQKHINKTAKQHTAKTSSKKQDRSKQATN